MRVVITFSLIFTSNYLAQEANRKGAFLVLNDATLAHVRSYINFYGARVKPYINAAAFAKGSTHSGKGEDSNACVFFCFVLCL